MLDLQGPENETWICKDRRTNAGFARTGERNLDLQGPENECWICEERRTKPGFARKCRPPLDPSPVRENRKIAQGETLGKQPPIISRVP